MLGIGSHYNWLSFPALNVSCQLATLSDVFWNAEQLNDIFDDHRIVEVLSHVIPDLIPNPDDNKTYFDGINFLNTREYIFYLESHNESLSRQLIESEMKLESSGFDVEQLDETFKKERLNDYIDERKQYGFEL